MGVTDPYPFLDNYVFFSSMIGSPNERVRVIRGHPAPWVREFKQRDGGDIYLCGGAQLAATLLEAGLIDEIVVKLNPLLLGDGLPLFSAAPEPSLLELAATKTCSPTASMVIAPRLDDARA